MAKTTLTTRGLAAIKTPESTIEMYDSAVPGFYVRVHPTGTKTFGCIYRVDGRQRRLTIGPAKVWSLADARDRAREAIQLASAGAGDMAQEKRDGKKADTFNDLAGQYMEKWAKPRKRSWREDRRIIAKYLSPAFGQVKAAAVRRADVRRLLDDLAVDAPIMSNRVLACVRKIYNWAVSRDLVETSPVDRVPAPAQAVRRDRVLSDAELRAVWTALDASDSIIADVYRLRLLTAQRGGEVLGMRWDEIDIDAGVWTIPSERSKNKMAHRVPLSDPVIQILERRRVDGFENELRRAGRQGRNPDPIEFVFPGRKRGCPIAETKRAKEQIAGAAAIPHWTGHDLRRTAATKMAESGTPRLVLAKILNHAEPGVTAVYDRASYLTEKREALDKWARTLARIVSGLEVVENTK